MAEGGCGGGGAAVGGAAGAGARVQDPVAEAADRGGGCGSVGERGDGRGRAEAGQALRRAAPLPALPGSGHQGLRHPAADRRLALPAEARPRHGARDSPVLP